MGCGISKSSVSIISSAHRPQEVCRSAHYQTNKGNTPRSDSNKPNPTGDLPQSLNQSLDNSIVYSPLFNLKSADSSFNRGNANTLRRGESFRSTQVKSLTSLHQTSVQNANLHQTSVHNDSMHQTSIHNASLHQTNVHNESLHQTSFQNTSLHQTSFNNNSLLPEIGSDLEDTIFRRTGRRIRLETGHTSITQMSSASDSSLSPTEGYDSKSYADGRSIVTARTTLDTQSAVSGRTKSTYLQRSTYDFNEHDDVTSPVTSPTGFHGTQSRLQVVLQVPVRPPVVYGGNHFWWPSKRMLFNDFRHVKELDNAVGQVQLAMGMDAQQLVVRLKRHCEEEVDVARAIYRWMSDNIAFRPESSPSRREPTALQVLKDGKGTAKGHSLLYQYLCSLANLQCELVEGLCKQINFFPGVFGAEMCTVGSPMYHVWIKIRLCRRWYLLDVALSQQGCSSDHGTKAQSGFAEEMFLPRPSDLISTHFPMRSHGEQLILDSENQLLGDSPLVDIEDWAGTVVRTVTANEWGIKALSHQRGVIETDENEVWLQFMCPNIMEYHVCLEAPESTLEHQGHTLIYLQDDIVTAYVRLPGPGVYVLRLYASPCYVKPGVEGLGCKLVMVYTIHATGAVIHLPFSLTFDGLWSITPQLYDSGCRVLSTKGAEIMAVDGRLSVDLRLPVDAIVPNLVWFCKAREENINLDGFVYAEREGRLARIHLLCPHPGEYILLFQLPVQDPTYGGHLDESTYARFFITCQSPATTSEGTPSFPIFEHCLSGPFESIDHYGLWLPEQLGSTLYAEQGCCQFLLRQDRPVRIVHSIEGESGVIHREASRWILAERNGYDIIYHLRISEPGRYRVTLSAGEYETTDLEIICVLMVDALVAYSGVLFPECDTIWGVEPSFHELGLCSDLEEQAKIPVKNGLAKLEIRARKDIVVLAKLFHANDKSMDMTEHRVVCRNESGLVIYVTLPFKGYYRLKITHNDQQVAAYLLSCETPAKPALPYEPFHTVYGITEAFTSHGLRELNYEHSPLKTAEKGKCIIRHSAPRGCPVHFSLVRNNHELKGCVYAERLSSEVVYHIELHKVGYYRFTCWSRFEDGKRDGLLFSYLILCPKENTEDEATLGPYPELSEIWGLNTLGFTYGVSVRNPQSSTIRALEGMCTMVISHPDEVEVSYTLEHPDLTLQEAKRCLFVEHIDNKTTNVMGHISISLPCMGRYALKVSAKKEGENDIQSIGTFLVISSDEEPGAHSFPVFSSFYEGCKLGEPKINPLSAGTEYFFQLEIPGARMVQLWDGIGRWRELLQPQEGSDVVSGMVNVGDPKELWVAGMYDPEFCHGNGGFRDLLMYEVI